MSVAVMGEVFKRYPAGGNEMLLALALADHAHDDGTRIFPSVETLAMKVRVSERTVQRLLTKMVKDGWLQLARDSSGGRGQTRHYRINPHWVNGDNMSPLKATQEPNAEPQAEMLNGDNLSPLKAEGVTPRVVKGDIAVSPEPSEPSVSSSYELDTHAGAEQKRVKVRWDDGSKLFVGIDDELMDKWEAAYKPLDIDQELTRLELWYENNPKKRKKNVERFITNCLSRKATELMRPRFAPRPARRSA